MTISVEDLANSIQRKLIGASALTDAVDDRVYTEHFYDFDNGTIEMPLVIIEVDGGSSNYGRGLQRVTVILYSYSKNSSNEAKRIYDLIYEAIHGKEIGVNNKGFGQEISRPNSGYNSDARSYFCRGEFLFLVAG